MTTDVKPDGTVEPQNQAPEPQGEGPKSLDEALQLINHLKGIKTEAFKERDEVKRKLKAIEDQKTQAEAQLLAEQGKYKELFEQTQSKLQTLEGTLKSKAVDAALKEALQKAGARSVDTVAKIVDKSKIGIGEDYSVDVSTIQAQIEEIKKADPILFGVDQGAPPAKRPSDGVPQAGYEAEIKAAKSQDQILAVMKKYGKI